MTSVPRSARLALPIRPLFVATVLLGSFLLFLIQPMFARAVLPLLGGSPSVWNTAMLFYQVTLLAGYLYAHLIRRLPIDRQLLLHLALFGAAALTLPIGVAEWLRAETGLAPVVWLLGLLAASIGPVFFVISAQAPLMQSWFGRSNSPDAANPYFLYAASNLGSFAALLAYPLLLEPAMALGSQALLWSAGFVLLALLVALCGLTVVRGGATPYAEVPAVAVTWRQRGRWTLLAFVASGLLLSTTTHLTTDIAAMPLLWVIPLGVYLISFILAFGENGPRWTHLAQRLAPLALAIVGIWSCLKVGNELSMLLAIGGIVLLFLVALALHGTLALEKPEAGALTDFYLWISVGGALGGVLCALIAPVVFDWPYENLLLLIAAAALIPAPVLFSRYAGILDDRRIVIGLVVFATLVGIGTGYTLSLMEAAPLPFPVTTAVLSFTIILWLAALLAIGRNGLFAYLFAMLLLAFGGVAQLNRSFTPDIRERSFFGVSTIEDKPTLGRRHLLHGTTIHAVESLDPKYKARPMAYYGPNSGAGIVIANTPKLFGPDAHVAFLGLGAGTLACFATPGQVWSAYEIDPVVVRMAQRSFTFLKTCQPDMPIILGDARLTLQQAKPGSLDLLMADAFSSDSVPLHLMTREAFRVYGRALQPDGVLLVHISNKFLDLAPLVAAIAEAEGWTVRLRFENPGTEFPHGLFYSPSNWAVLTRTPERMAELEALSPPGTWSKPPPADGTVAWTDDFASILPLIKNPF
jgi:hypothetical protein